MGCNTSALETVQSPEPELQTALICQEGDSAMALVEASVLEGGEIFSEATKSLECPLSSTAPTPIKGRKKMKRFETDSKVKHNCTQMEVIVENLASHTPEPLSGQQDTPGLVMNSESVNYFEGTEMKVTENHLNSPDSAPMKSPHLQIRKVSPGREAANNKNSSPTHRRSPRRSSLSPQRSGSSRTNSQSMKTDTSHITTVTQNKLNSSKQILEPLKHFKTPQKKMPVEESRAGVGDKVDTVVISQAGETKQQPTNVQSMMRKVWREKPNSQAAAVELVGWFASDNSRQGRM